MVKNSVLRPAILAQAALDLRAACTGIRVSIAVVAVVFAVIFVNTTVNMTKTTAINDNEFF